MPTRSKATDRTPQSIESPQLRKDLYELASGGVLDERVLRLLGPMPNLASVEVETLEYRRTLGSTPAALARCAVSIVAMHNTFGGYVLLGVEEVARDGHHQVTGLSKGEIDVARLRRLLAASTGRTIDITYAEFPVIGGPDTSTVGILRVPKRELGVAPVAFGKDSPAGSDGPSYRRNDVYFRLHSTNAKAAQTDDWAFISGKREDPYSIDNPLQSLYLSRVEKIVDENLPDRNVICPKFVGRNDTIIQLWSWLADEMQCAKIIAGVGGKGKTSIAYQFAEDICKSRPYGLERVIWLTAKTRQFRGLKDDFDPIEAHYSSYIELLQVLCERNAILPEETEGATPSLLKHLLKEALAQTPTLVVVDDVDTLSIDDQRRVLETALVVGSRSARFLITTRKNFTYTDDYCIEIKGFNREDYLVYVAELLERLQSPVRLSAGVLEKMRNVTEGSPLYTESLLRLIRNNMPPEEAISRWRGDLGIKVRRAALEREISNLTVEARRLLLIVSLLAECSYTELRIVSGYEDDILLSSLDELRALFLVNANRITPTEARFAVQVNTRLLVLDNRKKLVADPAAIEKKCQSVRSGVSAERNQAQRKYVGGVIGQVNAFIRSGDPVAAVESAKSGLRKAKDHPDLLVALAKAYMALDRPDAAAARKAYQEAYGQGQRKYQFFAAWYECELRSKHPAGAVDVAKLALEGESNDRIEWLTKRAVAYKAWADVRTRSEDFDQALDDLRSCNSDLIAALPLAELNQKQELYVSLDIVARDIRSLAERVPLKVPSLVKLYDVLSVCLPRKSDAPIQILSLVSTLERVLDTLRRRSDAPTVRDTNLIKQRLQIVIQAISEGRRKGGVAVFAEADRRLEAFSNRFSSYLERMESNPAPISSSTSTFDIFLAHNSSDKKQVRVLAARLKAMGVKAWLDEEQIAPGQFFQDGIQQAIKSSSAIGIVVGPSGIGKWQALEFRTAISQAVERRLPVIPIYLPSAQDVSKDLPFLSELNHVIFPTLDDDIALDRLIWGVSQGSERSGAA